MLVNNAGYGYRAAVEEADDADIRQLFDTNVVGAVDMIKAVLPRMRANRSGSILNISSIGARISPAGSGYYSATKAALEGLSGSLRKELQPLGINVTVIEPGAFRTDFAGRSLTQSARPIEDYAETAGKRRKCEPAVGCWCSAKTRSTHSPPSPRQSARNWTNGGTSASAPGSRAERWSTPVWASPA